MEFLKALGVVVGGLLVITILGIAWLFYQLPSSYEVAQTLKPSSSQSGGRPTVPSVKEKSISEQQVVPAVVKNEGDSDSSNFAVEQNVQQRRAVRVLEEDFMNPQKPLVDACKNLSVIENTPLYQSAQSASAETLFAALDRPQQDPLADSAAPVLRYIFRAPGISNMMEMAKQAQAHGESEGLVKKAEFYYELYKAGQYLYQRRAEIDRLLQKSYNMHHFMKAVAQKPELSEDPAVLNFCEQLQTSVNQPGSFDADEAAIEMQHFFSEVGVDAQKFGYDPQYRSQIQVGMKPHQISLNESWLTELFRHDIQKADSLKKDRH